jgi:2-polyprenyl-3-methyl-5-hydroxy-6-metoxy-1,4-benzoquinol methylase
MHSTKTMEAVLSEAQRRARDLRSRYDRGEQSAVDDIRSEAARYQFYHNIEIVPGVVTAGVEWADNYVGPVSSAMRGMDMRGRRVLDIGCRDGALSFLAEDMGAAEVVGIDNDPSNGLVDLLIPFRGSKVQARKGNVNDLSREQFGSFDVVIFSGVIYHLRYPIWALRRISDILSPSGTLLIEGGFIDGFGDLPILFCPVGTDSPYEPTSVTFFNEAGLSGALKSLGFSDVRCLRTFLPTFDAKGEDQYIRDHFPEFYRLYAGRHRLSFCRKILSCVRRWDEADHRVFPKNGHFATPDILERYWDGEHAAHTTSAIGPADR